MIWAAKDNNLAVATMLLDKGHDVNHKESMQDKGLSGYAPLHWAAQKGQVQMVELLLSRGANPHAMDKHNNTAKMLAEKKGMSEVITLLDSYAAKKAGAMKKASTKAERNAAATNETLPASAIVSQRLFEEARAYQSELLES